MGSNPVRYLDDLEPGVTFECGVFRFTADEIVAFAARFDPQPFHLDQAAAELSYFGTLVASGVHTQAAAIGLLVRAVADVAVVAGSALHEARFFVPVLPEVAYRVVAEWTSVRASARNPARGVAQVTGQALDAGGRSVMRFGVTYIVARRRPD